jgi:hypothetical protein
MVHALEEFWRVLAPEGVLVDLRPLGMGTPLFIRSTQGWRSAGPLARDELRQHVNAANQAIRKVVRGRLFLRKAFQYFTVYYYWDDLEELHQAMEGSWKGDLVVSVAVWKRAHALFADGSGRQRVRIPVKMKITTFRK